MIGPVALSFVAFLLLFTLIGMLAATKKQNTEEDYLVASRSVSPWSTALSAVATNNSGFMFIGLIGETYLQGLSSLWIMTGWVFGDYLIWRSGVPQRLRERSEESRSYTIPSFLAHQMPGGRLIGIVAGLVIVVFLGAYAAAQLTAGSKALHVLFGWDYSVGAIIGAVIVAAYCFSGGIRASIWTDVAQSMVMMVAMLALFFLGARDVGGVSGLFQTLRGIDPQLMDIMPPNLPFGFGLFIFGWICAGLGTVGQPHVMIRAMAIDDPKNMALCRRVYISWYTVFAAAAIGVGLVARVTIPETQGFDAELAMPTLATQTLPPVLVGLVLAGLFSATMSTADSQVLSCSAAITQDIFPGIFQGYGGLKIATLGVTAATLFVAMDGGSVFQLVALAWSALAATLGPLLIVRCLRWHVSMIQGLVMMLSGLIAVMIWRYGLGYHTVLFEALPGMVTGFLVYGISRPFSRPCSAETVPSSS